MIVLKDISIEQIFGEIALRGTIIYDDIKIPPLPFLIELQESIAATLDCVREAG